MPRQRYQGQLISTWPRVGASRWVVEDDQACQGSGTEVSVEVLPIFTIPLTDLEVPENLIGKKRAGPLRDSRSAPYYQDQDSWQPA